MRKKYKLVSCNHQKNTIKSKNRKKGILNVIELENRNFLLVYVLLYHHQVQQYKISNVHMFRNK